MNIKKLITLFIQQELLKMMFFNKKEGKLLIITILPGSLICLSGLF